MKTIVSEKGQVTIPKKLRDRLGIRPGATLDFDEERGRLVARKVDSIDPLDEYYGILKDAYTGHTSDELIEEMRGPGPEV